jgi:DNA-binding transcriptional MocR family regulator
MKRYETLAHEISLSILAGVLAPGARLLSVRQVSAIKQLSASTVFRAYYLLEEQGLIEARARSGYYVTVNAAGRPPEPELRAIDDSGSALLNVSERVFEVLESTMRRQVVPFGSAFPSPLLFPLVRLGRILAASVQELDPWATVDDLTPGSLRLRRQIALRYLVDGVSVSLDDIVITNGALDALNLCLMAVTRPGDAVLIESPSFYAALQTLERCQLQAIEVPTHPREGMDLAAAERALERHRPKACWLMTNFQNPLGSSMPDEKKRALVALLRKYQVPLIEDDVYGELYFGEKRPLSAKSFDTDGLVMHCASFSKCLAPGYRIGWASAGRYAGAVARLKLTTSLATSAPLQEALAQYMEKGGFERHLKGLRIKLAQQQMQFTDALGRYFPAGTRVTRPKGGYFLWVEMPPGTDALAVHKQALAAGISVAPGPIFSSLPSFNHCLRLNYGHLWNAAAEDAMARLGRIVAGCRADA